MTREKRVVKEATFKKVTCKRRKLFGLKRKNVAKLILISEVLGTPKGLMS